ncbi:hypothetical protein EJV46_04215 [Roseococcus sp. SYP-B2431]|uniref:hypothetical protein n=1 Tax=Roseococcus sp. SYP-B2431 TaxID=2496640 RepID=UPI00103C2F1A|nr:hypothetical protein [Roseococcus sp. SYP-B2431]TCH99877.1 hypothetical protein EJV46_04215 [Roseococcus sp. SYP-B2431]
MLLLGLMLPGPGEVWAQGKESPAAKAPAGAPAPGRPRSCAAPLRAGCEAMHGSCQLACPPMWSTNPGAPAFTPTNRAACLQRCLMSRSSCLRTYGCW